MVDAKRFDPALLSQGERDEKTQFDQFGNGEVLMELLPKSIVGDLGVPDDGAGISQRDFFALSEFVRIGKVE